MFDLVAYVGNSGRVIASGVKNNDTGELLTGATASLLITNADGVALTGFVNPVALAHVTATPGTYAGALPYDAPLVADKVYYGNLIVENLGARLSMRVRIFARNRF